MAADALIIPKEAVKTVQNAAARTARRATASIFGRPATQAIGSSSPAGSTTFTCVAGIMKIDAQVSGIIGRAALVFRGASGKGKAVLPQRICLEERTIAEAVVRPILALCDTPVIPGSDAVSLSQSRTIRSLTYAALEAILSLQHVVGPTANAAVLTRARAKLSALICKTTTCESARIAEAAHSAVGGVQAVVTIA